MIRCDKLLHLCFFNDTCIENCLLMTLALKIGSGRETLAPEASNSDSHSSFAFLADSR